MTKPGSSLAFFLRGDVCFGPIADSRTAGFEPETKVHYAVQRASKMIVRSLPLFDLILSGP